ncbi:NnrS family protein [bacterium]|nr:NnrS family protein [bacterium]
MKPISIKLSTTQPTDIPLHAPIWRTGFRPFFLGGAAFAAIGMLVWNGAFRGAPLLAKTRLAPVDWHSHEMVFGYTLAVVAGFLLTAVRNWAGGRETARGPLLAALFALWVAARVLNAVSRLLPWIVPAAIDAAFGLAIAVVIARPILAARRPRDLGFAAWLVLMSVLAFLAHFAAARGIEGLARRTAILGVALVVLIIVVVAGRIVPNFTRFHMKVDVAPRPVLGWAAILSVAALPLLTFIKSPIPVGVAAFVAAGINLARLVTWQGHRAWRKPALFILHIAYAWLVVGLAMRGWFALFGGALPTTATHALTAGALGSLTLGMMAWVGLAHSGRPVVIAKTTVAAYALITAAALVRVFGANLFKAKYLMMIDAAGALWAAAFILYLITYAPILVSPAHGGGKD